MVEIYKLEDQFFIIKNGLAELQMVIPKTSTIALMDLGLALPAEAVDMAKAKKYSFMELKSEFLGAK